MSHATLTQVHCLAQGFSCYCVWFEVCMCCNV